MGTTPYYYPPGYPYYKYDAEAMYRHGYVDNYHYVQQQQQQFYDKSGVDDKEKAGYYAPPVPAQQQP